jgi:F420-non-reducing hydrogenase iron-sulfur subunit
MSPNIIVYVCHRNIPRGAAIPRQWNHNGMHIVIREVPCSGKMDGQYLMHAIEGKARGVCVVACPRGECHLGQGNYRAEIRIHTIQRLLGEIGLEPQRAELLHFSSGDSPENFNKLINEFVQRICALGDSPLNIENTVSAG